VTAAYRTSSGVKVQLTERETLVTQLFAAHATARHEVECVVRPVPAQRILILVYRALHGSYVGKDKYLLRVLLIDPSLSLYDSDVESLFAQAMLATPERAIKVYVNAVTNDPSPSMRAIYQAVVEELACQLPE
jgi:hypothetical protein